MVQRARQWVMELQHHQQHDLACHMVAAASQRYMHGMTSAEPTYIRSVPPLAVAQQRTKRQYIDKSSVGRLSNCFELERFMAHGHSVWEPLAACRNRTPALIVCAVMADAMTSHVPCDRLLRSPVLSCSTLSCSKQVWFRIRSR